MVNVEGELEESVNQAEEMDELKDMEFQSNMPDVSDELNGEDVEDETYDDYGVHREESDGEDLLENVAISSDTDEDDVEENIDYENFEDNSEPANSIDNLDETFTEKNNIESSDTPKEKSNSFAVDDDIEAMINNSSILIRDKKSSFEKNNESSIKTKEDEYLNKLLEDMDDVEETIEGFEHSFDVLAEIEEGCEFEQPVEEEILSRPLTNISEVEEREDGLKDC